MDQEQVFASFRTRFKRQLVFSGFALVAMAMILLGDSHARKTGGKEIDATFAAFLAVALISILITLVGSLKNWRCPQCNGYLGKSIRPRFCAKCGVQLRA